MNFPSVQYQPFAQATNREEVIAVDCVLPRALVLSHWRGAPVPPGCADDTSTGIALNALQNPALLQGRKYVTNNHFDVDGFCALWSIINPALALQHHLLLRTMALWGDFREAWQEVNEPTLQKALQLVCWMNTVEKEQFYAPFDSMVTQESEAAACTNKYLYFLEHFEQVLNNPEEFKPQWQEEYNQVQQGIAQIKTQGQQHWHPEIKLLEMHVPQPGHYYPLFAQSAQANIVLTIYPEQRYELEYKYTTWVDTATRQSFPRIHLEPLAQQLNQLETNPYKWNADAIFDSGPILRLDNQKSLDKATRFDHPMYRPIHPSSIGQEQFISTVLNYFRQAYQHTQPQTLWTWDSVRAVNQQIKKAMAL